MTTGLDKADSHVIYLRHGAGISDARDNRPLDGHPAEINE